MRRALLVLLWPILLNGADIRLERTKCYGGCPVEIIFFDDAGSAHYEGQAHVARIGHYTAPIDGALLKKLEERIRAAGFFTWPAEHGFHNVDSPGLFVTVGTKSAVDLEGDRKELANVAAMIDGVALNLPWRPVSSGIRGTTIFLRVRAESGAEFAVRDDFELPLLPGTYELREAGTKEVRRVVVREGAWIRVGAAPSEVDGPS